MLTAISNSLTVYQASRKLRAMVSSRRDLFLTAFILFLAAGWIWLTREKSHSAVDENIAIAHQGFLAPDFTVGSLDDSSITLSSLRGNPVLMNVWASWCLPCRAEMPAIQNIYREYSSQGLQVLAINATNQDELADVTSFIQENRLTFPIFLDLNGNVSDLYQVRSLPTTYFIDQEGVIIKIIVGQMSEALLRIQIDQMLADKAGR